MLFYEIVVVPLSFLRIRYLKLWSFAKELNFRCLLGNSNVLDQSGYEYVRSFMFVKMLQVLYGSAA